MSAKNIRALTAVLALSFSLGTFSSPPAALAKTVVDQGKQRRNYLLTKPSAVQIRSSVTHYRVESKLLSVDIAYPLFSGGSRSTVEKLNAVARNIVKDKFPEPHGAKSNGDQKVSGSGDYKQYLLTPESSSGMITSFLNVSGAPHGNYDYEPINLQINPIVKKIELPQFFGKQVDYNKLSILCRTELYKTLKYGPRSEMNESLSDLKTWIEQGTDAQEPFLFSSFSFDRAGITFWFPQVARFPDAAPTVFLPYGRIRTLFAKKSPVYGYVQTSNIKLCSTDLVELERIMHAQYERFATRVRPE